MKVSLNIVKKLIGFELPPVDELVERINSRLGGVEEVVNFGEKYKDAKIVKVVECEKHPNADRLSICKIDAGTGELIQVVCGAPNVHADMWAVWLPPESIVPSTFDDADPFVLGARELRGVMSQGMLAAADELAIGSDHAGIVELTDYDLAQGRSFEPGASFAETFGLDDTIIDIENKMFTHRPDLFGQLGVAREISGIFEQSFTAPDWYKEAQEFTKINDLSLQVFNEVPELAPRFMAVAIKDISVKSSPLWLQLELVRMGSKSINNIVDATNYIMLMTAQPTHAYDYDKLQAATIGVRMAKPGEKIKLLNDKEYALDPEDIIIADGNQPIGLAGVMGGKDTEVDASTKAIVLECASFDMYAVRRSSMRHGLFTDALTRFNKGQSPRQNAAVMSKLMNSIGGTQASPVYDIANIVQPTGLSVEASFINDRLGSSLSAEEISTLLKNVEFNFTKDTKGINFEDMPFWRTDIELAEDIVEEVGRLHGFDLLPRRMPLRSMSPVKHNLFRQTKKMIRQVMKSLGANELVTYSFVHENVLKNAKQDVGQAFQLSNALSPDLQYYRLSVLPSLLDKVHMNIKAGHDEFTLYEIGKGHNKKFHMNDDDGLPSEMVFVDAVYASKQSKPGAPFYVIKQMVEQLASGLGFAVVFKPADQNLDYPVTAPFDLSRSAMVETADGVFIGMVGELHQSVIDVFKLPEYASAMTLDFVGVNRARVEARSSYSALSKYPSMTQDVSIRVDGGVDYSSIYGAIDRAIESSFSQSDGSYDIKPISIYQPIDRDDKTITLGLRFVNNERTLTGEDINPIIQAISMRVKDEFEAEIV